MRAVIRSSVLTSLIALPLALIGCGGEGVTRTQDLGPGDLGRVGDQGAAPDIGVPAPDGGPADPIEIIQIQVGDLVFDARAAGPIDGQVVILLHGFPQTSYEWRHVMPVLAAEGYRAIAPDQRGYSPGARPSAVGDYALANIIDDVAGIADAVGATRFHVVGHDWGAAPAWGVSSLLPARVLSLTVLSVPHPAAFAQALSDPESCQIEASAYIDALVVPGFESIMLLNNAALLRSVYVDVEPDAVDEYVSRLGTTEALGSALNWYRANALGNADVGPVSVPTLFIWSDEDPYICRDGVDRTPSFVTGPYSLEVLEGVNHWIADTAADQLNPLLLDHLGMN